MSPLPPALNFLRISCVSCRKYRVIKCYSENGIGINNATAPMISSVPVSFGNDISALLMI
jgi:hypothetical protein